MSCDVCLDAYSTEWTHNPVMLRNCGHTFCRGCLIKISPFICPTCRKDHQGFNPRKFPTNYAAFNGAGSQNIQPWVHTKSPQPSAPQIYDFPVMDVTSKGPSAQLIYSPHSVLNESTSLLGTETIQWKPICGTMLAFIALLTITASMIYLGVIKWHEYPIQGGYIPIWLIISGAYIFVTGLFSIVLTLMCSTQGNYTMCLGNSLTCLIMIQFPWIVSGCVLIYGAPQVHYDVLQNPTYCDYTLYYISFWILNSSWIFIFVRAFANRLFASNFSSNCSGCLMVTLTLFYCLFISMFFIAVFKRYECETKNIPIWVFVSGIAGIITIVHLSYFVTENENENEYDDNSCHKNLLALEVGFHIGWFITGSIWMYKINDLNVYCDYILYIFSFGFLKLAWGVIILGICSCCACCYFARRYYRTMGNS